MRLVGVNLFFVQGLFFDKPVSIMECLQHHCAPENLHERYDCEACKMKTESGEKQIGCF